MDNNWNHSPLPDSDEIAVESPVLLIKILSLFFLIFFIDTAPVFIKLTAKTGYDEYLKSLARQKILISTQELDEHHMAVIASAKKSSDQLMDYKEYISEKINSNEGDRSKYAEDFRVKFNGILVKRTDELLWKIEEAEGK